MTHFTSDLADLLVSPNIKFDGLYGKVSFVEFLSAVKQRQTPAESIVLYYFNEQEKDMKHIKGLVWELILGNRQLTKSLCFDKVWVNLTQKIIPAHLLDASCFLNRIEFHRETIKQTSELIDILTRGNSSLRTYVADYSYDGNESYAICKEILSTQSLSEIIVSGGRIGKKYTLDTNLWTSKLQCMEIQGYVFNVLLLKQYLHPECFLCLRELRFCSDDGMEISESAIPIIIDFIKKVKTLQKIVLVGCCAMDPIIGAIQQQANASLTIEKYEEGKFIFCVQNQ